MQFYKYLSSISNSEELHTLRQDIGVHDFFLGVFAAAEPTEETAAVAVAGRIIIGGTGAEAGFLPTVTHENHLYKSRDQEKDATVFN